MKTTAEAHVWKCRHCGESDPDVDEMRALIREWAADPTRFNADAARMFTESLDEDTERRATHGNA